MKKFILHFDISEKSVVESAEIVKEFAPYLENMRMYYYFPFSVEASAEQIKTQIKKDSSTFAYHDSEKRIKECWEKYAPSVHSKLNTLTDGIILDKYRCVLTFYGPYGYCYTPDTIYINVTKGNPDEWVETLLHELLHLVFFEKICELTDEDEERFIDNTFIELFGDIFPNYKTQEI